MMNVLAQNPLVAECRKLRPFIYRDEPIEQPSTPAGHVRFLKGTIATRGARMGLCLTRLTALAEIAAAYLGYVVVIDEQGQAHDLVFNLIAQVPVATATMLSRRWFHMLDEIQVELEGAFATAELVHQMETWSWAEQTKTLKKDIKTAARCAARWSTLTIARTNHELAKPMQQQFVDVPQKQADREARIVSLKAAHTEAKAAGNTTLADLYGKQLRDARREQIVEYATAHARWNSQLGVIDGERARFAGAPEREVAVRKQLAAHLAAEPKAPVPPRLRYGEPFAKVEKSHAQADLSATVLTLGTDLLRHLRKERDSIVRVLQPNDRGPRAGRFPISVLGATPMSGSGKMVVFDEADAEWLSFFHFVADAPNFTDVPDHTSSDADAERQFEHSLKDVMREKLAYGATVKQLALGPDAAQRKVIFCEDLRAARLRNPPHPILDAYLARVPTTVCVVAALLHLAMGETGPISSTVMDEAIDVCNTLISEFERAVVPIAEMSVAEKTVLSVRDALRGYVDKQITVEAMQPFRIAIGTLCKKSGSIGLPKAQIRRAIHAMRDLGWVRIITDGLDQVIELNPFIFDPMHR
ncbi:hypothetical protein CIC12_10640 [Burkholderia sp. SG-MS1]|uniref:DUF3987 domain-containing protein n=1 Tax=Paraburkholderia sp. SG-MS1 TaxID=2023741 RepID=UPI001446391A|nr:DUF3987 domain-containing protein [Paraburkholderia sp. SG-MS1]NKJ47191.1 hypothetical protein [Paraburkholderia sp. SG-MS1]